MPIPISQTESESSTPQPLIVSVIQLTEEEEIETNQETQCPYHRVIWDSVNEKIERGEEPFEVWNWDLSNPEKLESLQEHLNQVAVKLIDYRNHVTFLLKIEYEQEQRDRKHAQELKNYRDGEEFKYITSQLRESRKKEIECGKLEKELAILKENYKNLKEIETKHQEEIKLLNSQLKDISNQKKAESIEVEHPDLAVYRTVVSTLEFYELKARAEAAGLI